MKGKFRRYLTHRFPYVMIYALETDNILAFCFITITEIKRLRSYRIKKHYPVIIEQNKDGG